MFGFFLVALVLFSVALYGVGFYVWSVPQQHAADDLGGRLRELRAQTRTRSSKAPELLRREHRGTFAFLGDLVTWVGALRRLQEIIEQANLKYRAADVFGVSMLLAVGTFLVLSIFGDRLFLRIVFSLAVGFAPVAYIIRTQNKRLRKFE